MKEEFLIEHPYPTYERAQVDSTGLLFPVYQWDSQRNQLVGSLLAVRAQVIKNELFHQVSPNLCNNCKAVRRCFVQFDSGQRLKFTAFFVSPHILCTAAHVILPDENLGKPAFYVMSNIQSYIPDERLDEQPYSLTLLHSWQVPDLESVNEIDPESNVILTSCDFALFRVDSFESQNWLTPCSILPKKGDNIFTCQFNGRLKSLAAYERIPNFPKEVDTVNMALYIDRCSVSVGYVTAINEYQLSLNTSQSPGSSGAPCFGLNQIDLFCAIYSGSIKDKESKYMDNVNNHAILVDHPHFVHAFSRIVVPDLPKNYSNELTAYLSKHHM